MTTKTASGPGSENGFGRWLSAYTEPVYALLRIVAAVLFSFHGLQKVFGILSEQQPPVGSQLWIGGVLELVLGLAIALGCYTRISAFLASGMMAVAYTQFHWKFRFDEAFFPVVNRGELAVVYAFVFLYIACRGSGIWSVDGRRK